MSPDDHYRAAEAALNRAETAMKDPAPSQRDIAKAWSGIAHVHALLAGS